MKMSGVKRSSSAQNLLNFNADEHRELEDGYDDFKATDDQGQGDGLHKSNANPSLIPIQNALNNLLIEKAPDHLLIDKTPEGFRRIKGQKRADGDLNNNWKSGKPVVDRASYIPYPGLPDDGGMRSGLTSVELQVTNLDQSVDQKEMKKLITALFREHVSVLHVSVFFQSDGNMAACVRVPSLTDAQFAISQLHRKKVGFKRILISHSHCNSQNPAVLRSKVASILKEVPSGRIQLFKFREMFEKRFHDSIGVSDLYKMKDLVTVTEDADGRMVSLNKPVSANSGLGPLALSESYAAAASRGAADANVVLDPAFCPVHCSGNQDSVGWAEKENGTLLPNVNLSLSVLGPNMKQLVKSHGGAMPLASLSVCYTAVFGKDALPVDNQHGVALEHLVSCVRGIQIVQAASGSKRLMLIPNLSSANLPPHWNAPAMPVYKDEMSEHAYFRNSPFNTPGGNLSSSNSSSASSSMTNLNQIASFGGAGGGFQGPGAAPLAGQLSLFTRELVDLMKATPGCKMPFHKFIPSYHHHFGRQCRVADYGYTKLKDLFEALPHVVQIMGEGRSRAMITLSHRAQVKRFTSDLLRVLKSQASKQVGLVDLPAIFEKTLNRKFRISDYGVCDVEDMLQELSETSVVLSGEGDDIYIAIPKREQTQDEMERTHHFAKECIELLKHAPECRLPFNKFVPAYHHHFGRQCRVADYGFTKLIELFEAVPLTVEITEDADGERLLQLTDGERLKVLGSQIESLIQHDQVVQLDQLEELYRRQFGYPLRPDDYGQSNVVAVLKKLPQLLRVDDGDQATVRLIDRTFIRALGIQVKDILAQDPDGKMKLADFEKEFLKKHGKPIKMDQLQTDLSHLIDVETPEGGSDDDRCVKLTPLQLCAVKIQKLLEDHQDKLLCSEFEAAFVEKYSSPLLPGQYGYPSLNSLIRALPENFAVRGRGTRKMIWYLKDGPSEETPAASGPGQSSYLASRTFSGGFSGGSGRGFGRSSGSSGTTRFSTSRHEGFRMLTPTRVNHRQQSYGFPSSPWNNNNNSKLDVPTSPLRTKFKSQPISFPAPTSPATRRFNYPPPTAQQEMDLAQFGLYPGGHNGQMVPGIPSAKPAAAAAQIQRKSAYHGFNNFSATNPFLATPGNAFGGSKFMSTSPLTGTSPLAVGPSLFPVPHSPLFPSNPGMSHFGFPSQSSGNPWMSYYDDTTTTQPNRGGTSQNNL